MPQARPKTRLPAIPVRSSDSRGAGIVDEDDDEALEAVRRELRAETLFTRRHDSTEEAAGRRLGSAPQDPEPVKAEKPMQQECTVAEVVEVVSAAAEPVVEEPTELFRELSLLLEAPHGASTEELQEQLEAIEMEQSRLSKAYDDELGRCIELREALEKQSWELEASVADAKELFETRLSTFLEAVCKHGEEVMEEEDNFAHQVREITANDILLEELQQQVQTAEDQLVRLQTSPESERADEQEILAMDRQVSQLRADVEAREQEMADLAEDVRRALSFMISTNIEAAGGPSPALGDEDFLPLSVREHLGLSNFGREQVSLLCRRFELMVTTSCEGSTDQPPVCKEPLQAAPVEAVQVPVEPVQFVDHFEVADGFTVEERQQPTVVPLLLRGSATTSLAEEADCVRDEFAEELLQLEQALDDNSDPDASPLQELLRAARGGKLAEVQDCLWRSEACGLLEGEESITGFQACGWTVWHVAAAFGRTQVLELLKDDMVDRGAHHLAVLGQCTEQIGLTPLGIACLAGHVEAAKSLLKGMAPVDIRDSRGNTVLHLALFGAKATVLVPLLLDARADPEAKNGSGQAADADGLFAAAVAAAAEGLEVPRPTARIAQEEEAEVKPQFRVLRTLGATHREDHSMLSYTLSVLKAPVRDSLGFAKNDLARAQAMLSLEEAECGVWSNWVANYTHGGLAAMIEGKPEADPTLQPNNRQMLILTSERMLFFDGQSWTLKQVVPLSEIAELALSAQSNSMLLIRMRSLPDVILDVPPSLRGRMIQELELAASAVAARWGGADFEGSVRVIQECESVTELLGQRLVRIGTMAWLEANTLLVMPYAPESVLLHGGDAFFFGILDMHMSPESRSHAWTWQEHFFVLKLNSEFGRRLLWCRHPNDSEPVGSIPLSDVVAVLPLDTPQGDACLIIDFKVGCAVKAITLRSSSSQMRSDWIVSIRTMKATN